MSDKLKSTISAGASYTQTGLTEHGTVGISTNGRIRVECEVDDAGDGVWTPICDIGPGGAADVSYTGTKLRLTNLGTATAYVRVGQK